MSATQASGSAIPFESSTEFREAHAHLLDALDKELEQNDGAGREAEAIARIEPRIHEFLVRGAATGVFLEEMRERTACQVLLDYWVSSLAQAGRPSGSARLAGFDGGQLPDLKDKPNPYVGLDAFREPTFFFGRKADIEELLAKVRSAPLVVVAGASGSGKSSLVMAGLLPAITTEMPAPGLRVVPPFVPGNSVLDHFASALRQLSGVRSDPAAEAAALRQDPRTLLVAAAGAGRQPVLITIDQFEEVFTLSDEADRDALVANLAELLKAGQGHHVLLTMREEFRARVVGLEALGPYLNTAWYSIPPMGYAELRAAVEGPAALVNLQFQSGIVDDLVKKVLGQSAALPLLQFTLRALWEARDRNRITSEVYRKVGDPLHALAGSADRFHDGLAPETRDEVKRILLELVRVDELLEAYRQPVPKARLLQAGRANTRDVLKLLAENDYIRVTSAPSDADEVVEVKHESLVRNWPRYVLWIDEKRQQRSERLALTQAAKRWEAGGKPPEGLLTGWQLSAAESATDLPDLEREFVQASTEAVDRARREKEAALRHEAERNKAIARRFRSLWAVTVVLAVVAIGALVAVFWQIEQKRASESQAMAEAARNRERVLQAMKLQPLNYVDDQLDLALLLGIEANRMPDAPPELRRVLLTALGANPELKALVPGHTDAVRTVAYSPDARILASGSYDFTIILWDVDNGLMLHPPLKGHTGGVYRVTFSPNGKLLASAADDRTVRLWETETGRLIGTLPHDNEVYSVAIEKSGRILASADKDGIVRLWDIDKQKLETTFVHNAALAGKPKGAVFNVAFSPDGATLASAGLDGFIVLWDMKERKQAGRPLAVNDQVFSMAFSHDGKTIASGNGSGRVELWDVATRSKVERLLPDHPGGVHGMAFSPDDKRLATVGSDRAAYIRDLVRTEAVPQRLKGYAEPFFSVDFGADGTVATGTGSAMVVLWNTRQGHRIGSSMSAGPGDTQADFGAGANLLVSYLGGQVQFWDRGVKDGTRNPAATVKAAGTIGFMAIAPDRRFLATIGMNNNVELWDVAQQRSLGVVIEPGKENIYGAAFNGNGDTLAVGVGSEIRLLSVPDGKAKDTLPLRVEGAVYALAFSPDGSTLASAQSGSGITIWDLTTREPAVKPSYGIVAPRLNHLSARSLVFNPRGNVLVSGSSDGVGFWDSRTGRPLGRRLAHHPGVVTAVAVSPDGKLLASGSSDKSVLLWDLDTRQPTSQPIAAHSATVRSVSFSPDGRWLVSGARGGSVVLWELNPSSWLSRACEVVGRNFTMDEWKQFFGDQEFRVTCPRVRALEADARALTGDRAGAERLFREALHAALESKDSRAANTVCWFGSIHRFAELVVPACEKAVELAPDDWTKHLYQDSRGLARALAGDTPGALEDFTQVLKSFEVYMGAGFYGNRLWQRRKDWLAALKEGRNPFDDAMLKQLRME